MGQMIFSDIVPLRQRPKYFAMVLGAWAIGKCIQLRRKFTSDAHLGSILGPVMGGAFVQYLSWRWVFYLNLPFCVAGFIMVPLFVKLNADSALPLTDKMFRVDWVGSILLIGSTTSLLIGISWAGVQYSWVSVQTLAPIIIGAVGIGMSLHWGTVAREAVLRLSLFSNVSAVAAYYCAFAQGLIVSCFQILIFKIMLTTTQLFMAL